MEIIEIIVSAGRTFNHPYEPYSNFRPAVTLKATIEDNECKDAAVEVLQKQAERLVEENKARLLHDAEEEYKRELRCLEDGIPF